MEKLMIRKTTRRPATAAMSAAAQPGTAEKSRRAHGPKTGTRRRWLRAMAASLLALAVLFLGFSAPAQAAGGASLKIPLDGVALQGSDSLGGLTLSGDMNVVVQVGPRLTEDGSKTLSIRTNLVNVVASSATTSCRITGTADFQSSLGTGFKNAGEYKFLTSEPCASVGRPFVFFSLEFDSEGNVVSASASFAALVS
jgi:hypothetical protein